jgi:GAF domain-containing protein
MKRPGAWSRPLRWLLPEPAAGVVEGLQAWRERVLAAALAASAVLGAVAYAANIVEMVRQARWALVAIYTLAYLWVLAMAFARRLPFALRAYSVLFVIYGLGAVALAAFGLEGDGRIWLIVLTVMASVLLGLGGGLQALALSVVTLVVVGWLFVTGGLPLPVAQPANVATWISTGAVFLLLGMIASLSVGAIMRGLERSLTKESALVDDLERERAELRQRTDDLERRLGQIRSAAEISRALSGVLDPQALLRQVVYLIGERAEPYFVGVYLVEPDGHSAVLRAVAGQAGQELLESGHTLAVDESSNVGRAMSRGESDLVEEAGRSGTPAVQPQLPDTRSAAVLPLVRREQVLGALTVQAARADGFDKDDLAVLQGIADGLSIALENAQLVQDLENSLEEVRALHRQYLAETWAETADSARLTRSGAGELSYTFEPGQPIAAPADPASRSEVRVPLILRQQAIGQISLEAPRAGWSEDEVALIQEVAAQAALALENARLLEETQRRVRNERLIAEISARVRASTDLESVVRTAISELGRALNVSEGMIRLGTDPEDAPAQVEK